MRTACGNDKVPFMRGTAENCLQSGKNNWNLAGGWVPMLTVPQILFVDTGVYVGNTSWLKRWGALNY